MGTERIEIVLPAAIQEINATSKFSEFSHFYLFKRINMADLALEMDLSAMTVTDLKKALKVRGLTTTGVKQDLIERLQLAMATDEADPNNDTDLLDDANELLCDGDDEIVVPAPTTPAAAKKVAIKRDNTKAVTTTKIEAPVSTESPTKADDKKDSSNDNITIKKWTDAERAAARAARFEANANVAAAAELTSDTKKQSRAERFGITSTTEKATKIGAAPSADLETLKKRAERFGQSSSTVMKKAEMDEKIKKRQERFGVVAGEPNKKMKKSEVLSTVELNKTLKDEKLVKRAERFGIKA